jgi:hypothetical protein
MLRWVDVQDMATVVHLGGGVVHISMLVTKVSLRKTESKRQNWDELKNSFVTSIDALSNKLFGLHSFLRFV